MARRRRGTDAGGSLDSLLDTMTNVVGILIIVLIVTQVNVSSAAKRIRSNLPNVSSEDLASIKLDEAAERKRLEQMRKKDAKPIRSEQISELKKEREEFKEKIARASKTEKELKPIRDQLAKLEKDRDAEQKKLDGQRQSLAALRKKKDEVAEKTKERKVRLVRLPNPREPEKHSKEVRVICRGGRVIYLDAPGIAARLADRIKARKDLMIMKDGKPTGRLKRAELEKILPGFKNFVGGFTCDLKITSSGSIHAHFLPKDGVGELPEQLGRPESNIRRALAQAGFDRNFIRFYACRDSFEAYVASRAQAERMNLPVGWTFAEDSGRIVHGLPGVRAEPSASYKPGKGGGPKVPQPRRDVLD